MALTAPVVLMLVLGLVDFARAWNINQVITDAARQGARECAIDQDPVKTWEDVMNTVVNPRLFNASLDTVVANVTPHDETGTENAAACSATRAASTPLKRITVRIEYPYELGWIGAIFEFAGGNNLVTLNTEFTMWNE
jgi:Flp pilus assembly protein TadG